VLEEAERAEAFGLKFEPPRIDLDALRDKIDQIIRQLADGLDKLCQARKVSRLTGRGVIRDPKTIRVSSEGGEREITFKDLIIATGSHPAPLPDAPDDYRVWNSRDALALPFLPRRLLIVGGGIIGLEMAQVYSALGAEITLVEMRDQLIPPADKDVVQPLFQKLKKKYRIFTGTGVAGITARDSGLQVRFGKDDQEETGEFDAVLAAIGRKPNTGNIGLDAVGLELDEHGFLAVNERLQTSLAHFYAIGDVVGEPMLAHKASHQGKVAAEVVAGRKAAFTPMAIPAVAYTSPEIAWMGLTEKAAAEQGIEFDKGNFPWGASGRALSAGAANGSSKVLFDRKTGRIIGAGICGSNAGELIHEAVLALEMGADAEDISRTVHAHPTLAETFALAAEMVAGSITDLLPAKK
jgi:dihydrolipoamide dehydrogenase